MIKSKSPGFKINIVKLSSICSVVLLILVSVLVQTLVPVSAKTNEDFLNYYEEGVNQEKKGNSLQAVKNYSAALNENSKDYPTLLKLGLMYLQNEAMGELREEGLKQAVQYLSKARSLKPDDALVNLLLGRSYQLMGDYELATKQYFRAITLEPDNILLKSDLALVYFETKQFKQAIELFNKMVMAYPDNLKARGYLGAALQATDNYLAAIEQYNYVLNYEKDRFSIVKNLGDCWLALGQFDKAKEALLKAQQIDPKVPNVYADIAFIEHKEKNFDSAIQNYRKALALKNNESWRKALAHALWTNSNIKEAIEEFESIGEYRVIGYIYQSSGEKEKAIENYKLAIEKDPKDTKSMFNLANLYRESGKLDLAEKQYLSIMEQKPNDVESLFLLAVVEQERGELDKAIRYYDELLNEHLNKKDLFAGKDGNSDVTTIEGSIHYNLGLAYKLQNDLPLAERHFEKVLQTNKGVSNSKDLYKELSFVKIALGKNTEAEKLINDWLREDPTSVEARNLYADFLIHLSKERNAIEQLRLASVLDKTITTRLKLANLLHSQNNLYDALAEYQTVLQKEPNNLNALLGAANNFKSLGLRNESLNMYRQAVEKYPNDTLVHYNYGLLLQEDKQIPEAITHYKKVLNINPNFIQGYYVLGLCYWDSNQKDKAIEAWNKFLSSSSDETLKHEVLKLINDHKLSAQEPQQKQRNINPGLNPQNGPFNGDNQGLNQVIMNINDFRMV